MIEKQGNSTAELHLALRVGKKQLIGIWECQLCLVLPEAPSWLSDKCFGNPEKGKNHCNSEVGNKFFSIKGHLDK